MEMQNITNSKELKGFVKGIFVIVGLFGVLYCGVAVLFFLFCKNSEGNAFLGGYAFILILVLVILPLLVFLTVVLRFSCLVKLYYDKLYGSSGINCEGTLLKKYRIKMIGKTCLILAKSLKPNSEYSCGASQQPLKDMLDMVFK